jgi:two-component system cell cycle sensor histidine kinase/response regulator CckA
MLATRGYEILDAADGEQAIAQLDTRERPIPLVISHLIMRGLNGRRQSSASGGIEPATKALFMSGDTDDAVIRSGEGLPPGTSFIQKPFNGDKLSALVRELLDEAPA